MEGATLIDLGGHKVFIINKDHNFEFTKCAAGNDCITYRKKGSELDEPETHLVKAQVLKDQQNGQQ